MQSSPQPFDPWTSSAEEALRAHQAHDLASGAPDPLTQHRAATEVAAARERCLAPDGGCAVLQAMATCALARLLPPQWLTDAFVHRHNQVTEAHVASWGDDKAFGRFWPANARLASIRRRKQQMKVVHTAVWRALEANPDAAVDAELFDQVSAQLDLGMCGASVRDRYYDALKAGMPNAIEVRDALRNSANLPESLERLSTPATAPLRHQMKFLEGSE